MNRHFFKALALFLFLPVTLVNGQQVLDDFETIDGWEFILSDGIQLELSLEEGLKGNAIRFDYDFTKGTGYGGIQKWFSIDLPENYEFSFFIKAESPSNNFEIKFIDSSGDNVWWVNNRNYDFPEEWTRIRIRPRHIDFAWGPTDDRKLKKIDRIEFTIASFVGGRGTVWIDNLTFEALEPAPDTFPLPIISAFLNDSNQHLLIDLKTRREFGGLQINWLSEHFARTFDVMLSNDGENWEKAYSVRTNQSDYSFIRLPEAEARYLRINLLRGNNPAGFGVNKINIPGIEQTMTINNFLKYIAGQSPKGDYPRYFLEQASYWTIAGVNNDLKEAMINEDGMVEVDKGLFSIEPMIKHGGKLFNWNNVEKSQSLDFFDDIDAFQFVPSVVWHLDDLHFSTGISASGEANVNSRLNIGYAFKNLSDLPMEFDFFLLIRPYQVNPYYQFLNLAGGAGKIESLREEIPGRLIQVDEKTIYSVRCYNDFGAGVFDDGNLVDFLRSGSLPEKKSVTDPTGLANGVVKYKIRLEPGEKTAFYLVVPFYQDKPDYSILSNESVRQEMIEASRFWEIKTDHIRFNLPESANRMLHTFRSNLIYILINRDKAGIQPGSRSYERSWIRDGSLTSSALLKSGIIDEVKDFANWYSQYQYESGKVPCVVDFRGPDPVPEHDSHGQLIYLIREYFNFTADTAFLRQRNENVLMAVRYIESLIAERSTDHFKYGNDSIRAYYGIVPESISHEGYSEKPMHSYWDNFFVIKGLKDALEIQKILGETEAYEHIKKVRDKFTEDLYHSIRLAMKTRDINYIPGCVELGDFDATSTTIALSPCNELKNLPRPEVYNTFEKYYDFFKNRRDGDHEWINYTPYETRLIGSFIILDQPERAHELIDFFLDDLRPQGWYHWAEVVWEDYRMPRFIGDMPHTWVGSDFINAIRSMFVYENEYDESLVLASALYQDWIDAPDGMSVENLPTYFGDISYYIKKEAEKYRFAISGNVKLPDNGMEIRNFNGSRMPSRVTINGRETSEFSENRIIVREFPAWVEIYY